MIYVDDRQGSHDLIGHLRHWSVPCELVRLDFADAAFAGNGPDGPVRIGIEIKKVEDALSCMADGRFSGHQLPGLVQNYDRLWMVVEGWYKPDFTSGILLAPGQRRRDLGIGARRFMYRDLDNWLTSMEMCAGIRVRRVGDRVESARVIQRPIWLVSEGLGGPSFPPGDTRPRTGCGSTYQALPGPTGRRPASRHWFQKEC